jgi:hypothetical protein
MSFLDTEPMRPIVIEKSMPSAIVTSDEAILDYNKASSYQNWHGSCARRMDRDDHTMAVVNTHAKFNSMKGSGAVDMPSFSLLPEHHRVLFVNLLLKRAGVLLRFNAEDSIFRCSSRKIAADVLVGL